MKKRAGSGILSLASPFIILMPQNSKNGQEGIHIFYYTVLEKG